MTDDDLAEHDLKALRECMEIASREPDRAMQLQSMLEDRPWAEVAQFACFCVQGDALRCKPWESPPCAASGDEAAQNLLQKMLSAGVSQFHPDPLAALEDAPRKQRRRGTDMVKYLEMGIDGRDLPTLSALPLALKKGRPRTSDGAVRISVCCLGGGRGTWQGNHSRLLVINISKVSTEPCRNSLA